MGSLTIVNKTISKKEIQVLVKKSFSVNTNPRDRDVKKIQYNDECTWNNINGSRCAIIFIEGSNYPFVHSVRSGYTYKVYGREDVR